MTERVRAVGYVRVSTEEQARDGYGLDAQRRAIQMYCDMHRLELVRVYEDAGVSGKSTENRDGLLDLLRGAERGEFVRVVFLKLDRLSRRLRDMLDVCDLLERRGVKVISIQEGHRRERHGPDAPQHARHGGRVRARDHR